jgi:hypothetical protein
MAAINTLVARDAVVGQLIKRENWAQQEPGVIVVFCIVFIGTIYHTPKTKEKAPPRRGYSF